jgi:hypothetical protein
MDAQPSLPEDLRQDQRPARMSALADIAAGGGLGLLIGYLLGLSTSPVVQGVVVAMTALLGAFLGFKPDESAGRAWRIGAFGLLCTVGITLGLAVRGGSLLTPSVKSEVAGWETAGYDKRDALAFVAYQRLGVKPAELTIAASPAASREANVLYAKDTRSVCNAIGLLSVPDKLKLLRDRGGGFADIAATAARSTNPDAVVAAALQCGG